MALKTQRAESTRHTGHAFSGRDSTNRRRGLSPCAASRNTEGCLKRRRHRSAARDLAGDTIDRVDGLIAHPRAWRGSSGEVPTSNFAMQGRPIGRGARRRGRLPWRLLAGPALRPRGCTRGRSPARQPRHGFPWSSVRIRYSAWHPSWIGVEPAWARPWLASCFAKVVPPARLPVRCLANGQGQQRRGWARSSGLGCVFAHTS